MSAPVVPPPEPPDDGADLLDDVEWAVRRYVVLPDVHATVAVVLWVSATHALRAFDHATRLAINSPQKRCGKSRALEVIEALVHKPLATTNASVAALFRVIAAGEASPPTLILDEADRLFGSAKKDEDNRDLIALLNNGFRAGKPTIRCVGPSQTPTAFSNYAMAAVAGIGRLPDTIEDRAVVISMRRRLPGEHVEKYRLRSDQAMLHALRDRLATWTDSVMDQLEKPPADLPPELEDRAEDAWEPLLAVADAAGGHWPARARTAATALATAQAATDSEQSGTVRLLADCRAVLQAAGVPFLPTKALLERLRALEESPWGEVDLTARKLAARLATFGVKPGKDTSSTVRGWHRHAFTDAFARYLPPDPSEASDPSDTGADQQGRPDGSERPDGSTRPEHSTRPDNTAGQSTTGRVGRIGRVDPPDEEAALVSEAEALVIRELGGRRLTQQEARAYIGADLGHRYPGRHTA